MGYFLGLCVNNKYAYSIRLQTIILQRNFIGQSSGVQVFLKRNLMSKTELNKS